MTGQIAGARSPAQPSAGWPSPQSGKTPPGTLVIFWDYDTGWGADRSREPGGPKSWGAAEFEHTDRLLEIHAEYGLPACFAVVGSAALAGARPYHDAAQIRRIDALGHEVGSHSFRHEWLPGLERRALEETLRASREALEQCVGKAVTTFVPPFNQPFDYPRGLSFSRSERREARGSRNGLSDVCRALEETGYRVCRVAYRSVLWRAVERLAGRRLDRPMPPRRIAGVTCLRLNTPGGFGPGSLSVLRRCAERGGIVTAYGHPHSLQGTDFQNERWVREFLAEARRLQDEGRLRVRLPGDWASSA